MKQLVTLSLQLGNRERNVGTQLTFLCSLGLYPMKLWHPCLECIFVLQLPQS